MSQRECAGFNWPPLSIPAEEPVSICPEAVKRAGPQIAAACARSCGDPLRSISDNEPPNVRTFFSPSAERGVGHDANSTVLRLLSLLPAALLPFCAGVPAIGVGHPANIACSAQDWPNPLPVVLPHFSFALRRRAAFFSMSPLFSCRVGVAQPVIAISDIRRTDARSRERNRPDGVIQGFQVSLYKVDPRICVFARNLLSKEDCRAALADEFVPDGPQMALVVEAFAFTGGAERLARAGSSPNRSGVVPSGTSECVTPTPDAGEEVALRVSSQVVGSNVDNASLIDIPGCDVTGGDQVP